MFLPYLIYVFTILSSRENYVKFVKMWFIYYLKD
jgi:hypothetical protein